MQRLKFNYVTNNTTMFLSRRFSVLDTATVPAATMVAGNAALRILTESGRFDYSAEYSNANMDWADEIKLRKIFIIATKIAAVTRSHLLGSKRFKAVFPPIATVTAKWVCSADASLQHHDVHAAIKTGQAEE